MSVIDYYLASFTYKLSDGHIIGILHTGVTPKESLDGILSYLDGEIANLTEVREKIKQWATEKKL